MRGFHNEAWVTYVLCDTDVPRALTLSWSLKDVLTTRKLVVIASPQLSRSLKESLQLGFDFVFYLQPDLKPDRITEVDFAKLTALNLISFEKIGLLAPHLMIMRNCDELFHEEADEKKNWMDNREVLVALINPSLETYNALVEAVREKNGLVSMENFWNKLISFQAGVVTFPNGEFVGEERDVSIVNMDNFCIQEMMEKENLGVLEELVLNRWKNIFQSYVQPLLQQQSIPSVVAELIGIESGVRNEILAYENEPIAIVGMSCRYPGANNLEEFWNILVNGEDATGNPPEFRWLKEQCIRSPREIGKTNAGFLKCPVDDFDAKFFGISPKEMVFLDPQHRLLHELVWEGLEDAAVNPQELRGTNGSVFIGSWLNNYKEIVENDGNKDFYRTYMGNSIGAAAARISFLLGMTGPSIATESGCSSAMVAVHLACRSLQLRETNLAFACGVNLLLHPFDKDEMPMVISPEGRCKTFDEKADGFARAEGCGVLVLKRLSDAVRDEDKIWGMIRGSGMSQEGISKSLGTPTVHCESMAMKLALKDAEVDPAQISYVEAHGTGTVVGDPMEVAAIAQAYHSKERKEPLLIGSVKTNVGHTESCSGITGIQKVVLAMQHEIIPAHRNFEILNPSIDLEAVPARIPLKSVEWKKRDGKPRLAGVSSFGITGTDTHVIIEETPPVSKKALASCVTSERPLQIMKISAKTEEAMDMLLGNYETMLETSSEELKDLAYTANIGRADFSQRVVIIAKSKGDAIKIIQKNKLLKGEESSENLGKVCFLFTGQGSQYPGMAKKLYETSPIFRIHLEYCENILKKEYDIDIAKVRWSDKESNEISRTIYSQTSIFCVEYALLKLWESWGVKADYALGHSLGEFAAAVCAGILNVKDAIKLVAERSRLIDQLPRGKMLVIKANHQKVDTLMQNFTENNQNEMLDYAAINSNEQTVVAGDADVVLQFGKFCKDAGLKCMVLEASHAFHSKHMDPMLHEYQVIANQINYLKGNNCGFISGMRGTFLESEKMDAEYWVDHTREKVLFMDASKKAVELGCKIFIEVGPQPVLSALTMMNNNTPLLCLPSLKKTEAEWETLLNTLGKLHVKGMDINWKGLDQFCSRKKVRLRHYPFIGKKYWPDMVATTGSIIHPLLGGPISNASSAKLFQAGLNLRSLDYVKDHAIGENIIFPGAGYLEMCLAAGLATIEASTTLLPPPTRAMKVENLLIQAPLSLVDAKTCQAQTVVELNEDQGDWNDMKVRIFRRVESESGEWIRHAQATFSPIPTSEDTTVQFDLAQFHETLKQPSNDGELSQIYDKLASVGLKFGPTFQSIEKLWRNSNAITSNTLLAKVKVPTEDDGQSQYIVHPVVLDAMIQAIMMLRHTSNIKKKLYVPIKIGKFVWLRGIDTSASIYIHAYNSELESNSSATALLVDSTGFILAVMSAVELIDTTVKAIDSILEQQTISLPNMWEEVWKPQMGPLQHRLALKDALETVDSDVIKSFERYNNPPPHLAETFNQLEDLSYLYYLKAFYDCGWKPSLDQVWKEDVFQQELGIQPKFKQYFLYILEILEGEDIFQKRVENEDIIWTIIKMPPSLSEVVSQLNSPSFTTELSSKFRPTLLLSKYGENLGAIMRGNGSALSILFPDENKGYPSVFDFYQDYASVFLLSDGACAAFRRQFANFRSAMKGQRFVLRVLEVGAGTGSYSSDFINCLDQEGIEFEYTYTDISSAFFPAAKKKFEKYGKQMIFKKLNIEEDPLEQGFSPEYFDYVYMAEVIHATRDVKESLQNIWVLMKPYALLGIMDQTRVNKVLTFLFGGLDGFWRFQDFDLRPKHCTISLPQWESVFSQTGFKIDATLQMLFGHHSLMGVHKTEATQLPILSKTGNKAWLLFGNEICQFSKFLKEKLENLAGRRVFWVRKGDSFINGVDVDDSFQLRVCVEDDFHALFKSMMVSGLEVEGIVYCWALNKRIRSQDELLQPFFHLIKGVISVASFNPRIVSVTSGAHVPLVENDLSHFHASTLWAFTKVLKNENSAINCSCIELIQDGNQSDSVIEEGFWDVFHEIWSCGRDVQVAYSGGTRLIPKLTSHKPLINPLQLPKGTDKFQLILPETKAISDLQFGPLQLGSLKEDEVEVQIKASALNFRDVLSVIKPSEEFKDVNTVGFDFAGVIKRVGEEVTKWKVGDYVYGCNIHFTALPSHVQLSEDLLMPLVADMTLCEAATLPAVYMTSIVCLLKVAKIKKEDVVLLHTASGGVGLSAIEICKHVGCTIIATAGSKRKQNYLRSLGIQHIFNSRNTQFGEQILELTNGRGVDVVLNSLTSEGFKEATLKACAKGARFVEMSRLNIWTDKEVKALRPDVEYTTVDLSQSKVSDWKQLVTRLKTFQEEGIVKPIPYAKFDALNIREALSYMQKAKHVGKIVCVMPEIKQENGKLEVYTPMFNDRSTYLITGGLGGIGFVVCKWMGDGGAKHIILASRSPPTPSVQAGIKTMNIKGANVIPVQLDVGNFEECKNLIEIEIGRMGLPPLRGVMHAAGILADGVIVNHEWSKLSSTFNTKINGTINLHGLTKNLNLEHFVMFSSMGSVLGAPGQCNHAAGNCYEDAISHYRHSIGLPATSVNWGQWGEVGVATEVDLPGVKTLSNRQGITGLEYAMKSHRTQTCIMNVGSFVMMSKLFPHLALYLDERIWKKASVSGIRSVSIKSEEFWQQYDSAIDHEGKDALIKTQLRNILRNTLKLDENEVIGDDVDMQEMGVDSLMFVEIKNGLQTLLGERFAVSASLIKDANTISSIATKVIGLIEAQENDCLLDNTKPTLEAVNKLLREDSKLPEHIRAKAGQEARPVREIRTVLLTGSTGTLGPYILKELPGLPQITQVVCLIRPSKAAASIDERLTKVLKGLDLLSKVEMRKIRCVSGNVAEPNLGLKPDVWSELSEKVDAIINCAASVNHTQHYVKTTSQKDMRAVNIGGIKHVLEFACENKLKHVYHSSTIGTAATIDENSGRISEKWPEVEDFENTTTFGYPVSKFVSDVLIKQAVERGIPAKVFRLPIILGEMDSGRCSITNNHVLLRYLFILKNGVMPSNPLPMSVLPVDTCAEVSVRLFFEDKAPIGMYNILHSNPDLDQGFVEVAKRFGYRVDIVEFNEFAKRVVESGSGDEFSIFKELYSNDDAMFDLFGTPTLKKWVEGNEFEDRNVMWKSNKIESLLPEFYETNCCLSTMELVYRDLLYLKKQGWFNKLGL